MAQNTVEKLVRILIEAKGADETQKQVDETFDRSHEGMTQTADDAVRTSEKVDDFLRRWKYQLSLVGAGLAGIYGLTKYSPVAAAGVNLLGASVGALASSILIYLLPEIIDLSLWLLDVKEKFDALPEPVKILTSKVLGLGLAFGALKVLGIVGLFKGLAGLGVGALAGIFGITAEGGIVATLGAMLAAGGAAAAAAVVAAVLAGIAAGLGAVWLLLETGFLDAVDEFGRFCDEKFPEMMDFLRVLLGPLALLGVAIVDIVKGDIDKIPEHLGEAWQQILDSAGRLQTKLLRVFSDIAQGITDFFAGIPGAVVDAIGGAGAAAGNWIRENVPGGDIVVGGLEGLWNLGTSIGSSLPRFDAGGYVSRTGLAVVHEGEWIQNRYGATTRGGEGSGGDTYYITITGQWKAQEDLYRDFIRRLKTDQRRIV